MQLEGILFQQLAATTQLTGTEAYLVGGYVRDIFLKRNSKDIDVVVLGDGIEFAKTFKIMSVPTFILMDDGKEVDRLIGAQNKESLLDFIKTGLDSDNE